MKNYNCSVIKKGTSYRIAHISYDERSYSVDTKTLNLFLNGVCVACFYDCIDYEFLKDRTYIFIS